MKKANPTVSNHQVISDIEAELAKARQKFPGTEDITDAITEELGELCKAKLEMKHEPEKGVTHEDIYKEAIQVAVMAIRFATEGQEGHQYHPESGYRGKNWDGYID